MRFFQRVFPANFNYNRTLLFLWIALSLFAGLKQYLKGPGSYNNYLVFKHVFINTLQEHHLYLQQPEYFFDSNVYGPFFAVVIAPFALLPDAIGIMLWALTTALLLFWAVNKLPLPVLQRNLILLVCTNDLFTSLVNLQSNPIIAALIIFTFVCVQHKKELWAGLFIAIGFLIKLYGVVGFAFILFTRRWLRFIGGFLLFLVLLALLPIPLSSLEFQLASYQDWYMRLLHKNQLNEGAIFQNISAIGFFQRSISPEIKTGWVVLGGLALMLVMTLANIGNWTNQRFQYLMLSAVLLFTVLFSSGSESATYVVALPGVAIWYLTKESKSKWDHFLFAFGILASLSSSDLFTPGARDFVRQYALKAFPCFLIWLEIIRESVFNLRGKRTSDTPEVAP